MHPVKHKPLSNTILFLGAIALVSLAAVTGAEVAPDPCDDYAPTDVNIGSGVDLPFVPNVGQSAPAVRYQATALGGGSLFFDDDAGVTLALNENDGEPAANGSLTFLGTTGSSVLVPGTTLPGTADIRLGSDSRSWYSGLPLLDSITYSGLYAGVDLTYTGDGRRLDANLTLAAGVNPAVVRFSFGGETASDESGGVTVGFSAGEGPTRQIELDPPKASQNGEALEAGYVVGKGIVSLAISGAAPGQPVDVKLTLTLGPHVQDYAATRGKEEIVVAGASASPVLGATGRDMFVARLAPDGTVLHTTFLGGSGDDTAEGVAIGADGQIVISGTTSSSDFAVTERAPQRTLAGGSDATVTVLADNGTVLVSTYVGGNGDDTGHGVAIDGDGEIWLASTSDQPLADVAPQGLTFSTVFPAHAEPATALTLNVLEAELASVRHRLTLEAPLMHDGIPVWVNCNGHILLGTPTVASLVGGAMTCDLTYFLANCGNPSSDTDCYEIDFASGYDGSSGNWGDLGLQWKEMKSGEPYTPGAATWPNASQVEHGSHVPLNTSEDDPAVFPNNPAGTWQSNWARNFGDLAVGATLYHNNWNSPVFADFSDPGMITGTYWRKNNGNSLITICDLANANVGNTDNTIDVVDEICTDFGNLTSANPDATICQIRSNQWINGNLIQGIFTNGVLFDFGFRNAPGYLGNIPGQPSNQNAYVGDPPEEDLVLVEPVQEIASRLRQSIYTIADVERTEIVAGQLAEVTACKQAVRIVDLATESARIDAGGK